MLYSYWKVNLRRLLSQKTLRFTLRFILKKKKNNNIKQTHTLLSFCVVEEQWHSAFHSTDRIQLLLPCLPCLTCKPHTISGENSGKSTKLPWTGESRCGSWLSEVNLRWSLRLRRRHPAETEWLSAAVRRADKSQQNVPSRLNTNETLCAWQPDGCLDVVFICRPSLGEHSGPAAVHPGASW